MDYALEKQIVRIKFNVLILYGVWKVIQAKKKKKISGRREGGSRIG